MSKNPEKRRDQRVNFFINQFRSLERQRLLFKVWYNLSKLHSCFLQFVFQKILYKDERSTCSMQRFLFVSFWGFFLTVWQFLTCQLRVIILQILKNLVQRSMLTSKCLQQKGLTVCQIVFTVKCVKYCMLALFHAPCLLLTRYFC